MSVTTHCSGSGSVKISPEAHSLTAIAIATAAVCEDLEFGRGDTLELKKEVRVFMYQTISIYR